MTAVYCLQLSPLVLLRPHLVRWLSMGNCAQRLVDQYPAVVALVEKLVADGKEDLQGLLSKLKSFSTVYYLHAFADLTAQMNRLSMKFQAKSVDFTHIKAYIFDVEMAIKTEWLQEEVGTPTLGGANTKRLITDMMEGDQLGDVYREMTLSMDASLTELQLQFTSYARVTLLSIAERFEDRGLMGAFGAFEPKSIPSSAAARKGYGISELKVLIDHYGKDRNGVAAVVDGNALEAEYTKFKNYVADGPWRKLTYAELVPKFCSVCGADYPNVAKLLSIGLILPVTTVPCEQLFSAFNFIKNDYRSMLTSDHATDLMRVCSMYRGTDILSSDALTVVRECAAKFDLDKPHKFHALNSTPRSIFSWRWEDDGSVYQDSDANVEKVTADELPTIRPVTNGLEEALED